MTIDEVNRVMEMAREKAKDVDMGIDGDYCTYKALALDDLRKILEDVGGLKSSMIDAIKNALEKAQKHFINPKVIACSIADYKEVKRICKENFPQILVFCSGAVENGRIYLWDGVYGWDKEADK